MALSFDVDGDICGASWGPPFLWIADGNDLVVVAPTVGDDTFRHQGLLRFS
jgi:hypothetical protein